jgi:hypothetical protein
MDKFKYQKAVVFFGLAITLIGLTFKLNELMFAPEIFNGGIVVLVLGFLWWGVSLISS